MMTNISLNPHRSFRPTYWLVITMMVFIGFYGSTDSSHARADRSSGEELAPRLERFEINAPQLRVAERTIEVYLPPDYEQSDNHYPVIYLHDGGLLFSTNDSRSVFFDTTLTRLYREGKMDGVIAVGIYSSTNRWDEYSPWETSILQVWLPEEKSTVAGGEGDAYLDFIINTLKPEIDLRYRTLTDREHTAIGGFSMGGLISLYAGLSHPEVFSRVMAMSPAVWFAEDGPAWLSNNQLIDYINANDVPKNVAYYIDVGTNEWADFPLQITDSEGDEKTYPQVWVEGVRAIEKALLAKHVPPSLVHVMIDESGIHEVNSWGDRFGTAITWLMNAELPQETINSGSVLTPATADPIVTANAPSSAEDKNTQVTPVGESILTALLDSTKPILPMALSFLVMVLVIIGLMVYRKINRS